MTIIMVEEVDSDDEISVEPSKNRICLNMIVKNESRIIRRLLESCVDLLDFYCICDTGSTDNTIEIIEYFFQEKGIPGKVIQEPFRDFGYNRSFALKACESVPAEYILLLDADMIFWRDPSIPPEEFKRSLTSAEAFYIFQGSDTYYYKNTRIVKNNLGFSYWGVTHEYVNYPKVHPLTGEKINIRVSQVPKDILFIKDIGDGGAKTDKFLRDVRLLEQGLVDLPNNDRYLFYLANSYRDSGQQQKAIEIYKKRIAVGGWIEEIWYSYYSIGKCWRDLKDMDRAIAAWMDAFQVYPNRIENLYEIVQHYRVTGKNQLSYWFYMIADRMRREHPEREYLFMQKDVYDFKLDYELSILGYYVNIDNHDLAAVSMKVLADRNVSDATMTNILSNYKFYCKKRIDPISLNIGIDKELESVLSSIGSAILKENPGFKSSTPSFCCLLPKEREAEDGILAQYLVNVRLVNYWINDKGGYENPGTVHTINVLAVVEHSYDKTFHPESNQKSWKVLKEGVLEYDTSVDNYYIGLEDIRLAYDAKKDVILYNANRGVDKGMMVIEHGYISIAKEGFSTYHDVFLETEKSREIEKNWVIFPNPTDNSTNNRMIYGWFPLTIGSIASSNEVPNALSNEGPSSSFIVTARNENVPPFFRYVRGSTNGITMPEFGETWFMAHVVSYEDRRYYYHVIIALDSVTGSVKRYTPLFTFEGEKVEYVLGFERLLGNDDSFLVGYSLYDRETKYICLSKESILRDFIDYPSYA
jgi:tetratricopeptide (TPR) repeat protein